MRAVLESQTPGAKPQGPQIASDIQKEHRFWAVQLASHTEAGFPETRGDTDNPTGDTAGPP